MGVRIGWGWIVWGSLSLGGCLTLGGEEAGPPLLEVPMEERAAGTTVPEAEPATLLKTTALREGRIGGDQGFLRELTREEKGASGKSPSAARDEPPLDPLSPLSGGAPPPGGAEVREEGYFIPPPPEVPEADGVAEAQRQRSRFAGSDAVRPPPPPSQLAFPGSGQKDPVPLPGGRSREEAQSLGLLAQPEVSPPEPMVAGPAVQLQPARTLTRAGITATGGEGAKPSSLAPPAVAPDRNHRPLVLFVPFRGMESPFHARILEEQVGGVLKARGEPPIGLDEVPPALRKGLPTPRTIEGSSALARQGVDFLVMGVLEDEPGGFLTLEVYQPPKSGVAWATSVPVGDATRPEGAVRQGLEKLLERLRQDYDHLRPVYMGEVPLVAEPEPPPVEKEGLPLAAREIRRLAASPPPAVRVESPQGAGVHPPEKGAKAPALLSTHPRGGGKEVYDVQVGAFQNRMSADQEVSTLHQRGYAARVVTRREQGEVWHLVRVGSYPTREEAEATARELRRRWMLNAFSTSRKPGE